MNIIYVTNIILNGLTKIIIILIIIAELVIK